jgi:hypothetical protein
MEGMIAKIRKTNERKNNNISLGLGLGACN